MTEYDSSWDSLRTHPIPRWFDDAALGVYFHWGPYAVPAFEDEWYSRNMYIEGSDAFRHHREEWGPQEEFGYKDFVPLFTGESFDADEWVKRCKEAGASFVGVTAVHADGFLLWDSEISEWNAANVGPEQDVLGQLSRAARKHGLKFVPTFHHGYHWWWYRHANGWDTADPEYAGLYGEPHEPGTEPPESFFRDWQAKIREVIDGYRPDLLWFDAGIGSDWFVRNDEYRREILAYYYNRAEEWDREVEVVHKRQLPHGTGIVDYERARKEGVAERPWLTDTSIDRESWCHVSNPDYKSVSTLITGIVDRASKNGCTFLNVGPKADGTIPAGAQARLDEIGDWFAVNGAGVDGTQPWWTFGEGPTQVKSEERQFEQATQVAFTPEDKRFTRKDDTLYVFVLGWPEDGVTVETAVGQRSSQWAGRWGAALDVDPLPWPDDEYTVELLGSDDPVEWSVADARLHVELPATKPCDHAYGVRIEVG
ncbi:alpha-L-fucosidase [Halococcus agarilyticus]|uniref:alpha-L-fucosidase n=1 Tax=Halococcus agarilyticus TaxID=1232219 RepID=UPI000677C988|nr:alpha-L-fucosidase [Halococcus agarilyticus]